MNTRTMLTRILKTIVRNIVRTNGNSDRTRKTGLCDLQYIRLSGFYGALLSHTRTTAFIEE